jgi:hypothetical protein
MGGKDSGSLSEFTRPPCSLESAAQRRFWGADQGWLERGDTKGQKRPAGVRVISFRCSEEVNPSKAVDL